MSNSEEELKRLEAAITKDEERLEKSRRLGDELLIHICVKELERRKRHRKYLLQQDRRGAAGDELRAEVVRISESDMDSSERAKELMAANLRWTQALAKLAAEPV